MSGAFGLRHSIPQLGQIRPLRSRSSHRGPSDCTQAEEEGPGIGPSRIRGQPFLGKPHNAPDSCTHGTGGLGEHPGWCKQEAALVGILQGWLGSLESPQI